MKWSIYSIAALVFCTGATVYADDKPDEKKADPPSYTKDVKPFLAKYCANCHNARKPRSGFSFDSYDALKKGGRKGPAVVPGEPDKSMLIRVMTGKGKRMPPSKNRNQPKAAEVQMLKTWITAGAKDDTAKDDTDKKGEADKKGDKSGAAPAKPNSFVPARVGFLQLPHDEKRTVAASDYHD